MFKKQNFSDVIKYLFVLFLAFWSFSILQKSEPYILHSVNLIFHEAGHMILMPFFGDFITALGGTLMQLAIPLMFFVYFLREKNLFASLVMSWWVGDNLIDVSIYISDAQARILPLLGGGDGHDWAYLLGELNILKYDTLIGSLVYFLGAFIMFSSLVFALLVIRKIVGVENKY